MTLHTDTSLHIGTTKAADTGCVRHGATIAGGTTWLFVDDVGGMSFLTAAIVAVCMFSAVLATLLHYFHTRR